MGDSNRDKATLAKARRELEDMYEGIPDDSVNLSFQNFQDLSISTTADQPRKPTSHHHNLEPIWEIKSSMAKLPNLDFNRALQTSNNLHRDANGHHDHTTNRDDQRYGGDNSNKFNHHMMSGHRGVEMGNISMASTTYDMSMANSNVTHLQDRNGRRRAGIPHSNICTICSTYIYIFRHRCLVCGRVYCRQCVMMGMGEMKEGRKCVQCLGRRFSQRYIQKAGKIGCCSRYPKEVKQAELKWAEKGSRRNDQALRSQYYNDTQIKKLSDSKNSTHQLRSTFLQAPTQIPLSPVPLILLILPLITTITLFRVKPFFFFLFI